MAFAFEKLLVYQKAMDFSDRVWAVTQKFPRGFYFLVGHSIAISSPGAPIISTQKHRRRAMRFRLVQVITESLASTI